MIKELLSTDGKLSTTSTVQLMGALTVFAILIYAAMTHQPYTENLLNSVLMYIFGSTTAKGVVTTVQNLVSKANVEKIKEED
ncbi:MULTISPECIES: DUF2644 domain-containing protein [Glaesserella]|uniref:Uncharacterized protein n=1 Tax=Glaesserella australis TaxID=2094024 RepID=A0A328BW51_9PAST|nr:MULTISPECIES: DUF2644 domain-containing protein [Glaesserella]AUI65194.1 hypothetical protein CJD39_00770 [Glaesserella sp. 15-184]RAL18466.1 hypothetical protein C5N92_07060 [Glaesserella australis]